MVNGQNINSEIVAKYPADGHEYPVNNCNPSRPAGDKAVERAFAVRRREIY